MEKLKDLHESAQKALQQLKAYIVNAESKDKDSLDYEQARCGTIHGFEYSFECLWKFLKIYVEERHGILVRPASPNKTFRICHDSYLISKKELAELLNVTQDRNLTTHTYIETIAKRINSRIPYYYETMATILSRLEI